MKTIAIAGCGKLGNIVADAIGFGIADVGALFHTVGSEARSVAQQYRIGIAYTDRYFVFVHGDIGVHHHFIGQGLQSLFGLWNQTHRFDSH